MFRGYNALRTYPLILLFGIFVCILTANSQQKTAEVYKILGISVEGTNAQSGTEPAAIISNSGLRIGDEITIPGDQVRTAIERLWALRIFSDIQISAENKVADGIYLVIKVQEHPRYERTEIIGSDDVDKDDIMKKVNIVKGQILTPEEISRIVVNVQKLYDDEGHLLAKIKAETVPEDSSKPNRVVLKLNIEEGPEVALDRVHFTGNVAVSEDDLKGQMDDTKEKVWWHIFSHPKLDKKKYEADKQLVIKYYRKNGYLDAEIVSDSIIYSADKKKVSVLVNVHEGAQYKVRSITWEGNTVYKPDVLSARLQFLPGDVYDEERFEQNLRGNSDQTDVASLYLDNGYLTFNLDPNIQRVGKDSLDITIHVYERNQFRIGIVDIKGNTKTYDNVIRRELYTRPGDFFSRATIIRSMRQLSQLQYFNPEKIKPDYHLVDDKTVDLTYEVEEKSSDNVNASVGYSGTFGVTGALGFTINNFALLSPLSGGGGQILNFDWQFGEGARFRTFSLSFTEPWLYNTPTTLGVSLFDTRQIVTADLQQTGISVRLGRRLKWPDDYFRADWTIKYQNNNVYDNGGIVEYGTGKSTQFSVSQTISRNSTDSPIFPSTGSSVALSLEVSGHPLLPGNVDFHKWLFSADWYTPLFSSNRLVLFTSTTWGYLAGISDPSKIPYIEYFYMGGTGIGYVATTPLRGYEDHSIGPLDAAGREVGGRVMSKHTTELRLAVTLNPVPIYFLGFAEAGNVYEDFSRADFLDLKRSYGFGARILINPIGLIGFDYGYGADDVLPKDGKPDGWRFHFQFGKGF